MSKLERKVITSPVGEIKYAHITKPNTKFKADGEYSCDLLLDPDSEAVQTLKETLEAAAADARAQFIEEAENGRVKKAIESASLYIPIQDDVDKDGNETGKLLLKVKNAASGTSKKDGTKFERRIKVFDAKGKLVDKPLRIGRGTTAKVAFIIAPFYNAASKNVGVTLWFEAIQVINLVEFGGGNASDFGFGEEQGYEYDGATDETFVDEMHNVPTGAGARDGDY